MIAIPRTNDKWYIRRGAPLTMAIRSCSNDVNYPLSVDEDDNYGNIA